MLRDTPNQRERQRKKSEMVEKKRHKSYDAFQKDLSKMTEAERESIRFGTYRPLWESFPAKLDLEGNVDSAEDPGDGKIYDQSSIQEVNRILKAFFDAWSEATMRANSATPMSPTTIRKVGKIPELAKVCLILRGMKQERLLDCFCEASRDDKQLPFKPDDLKNIFDQDEAVYAETFCTEQYRAICRPWNDGQHITIPNAEPLPLKFIKICGSGSYGNVMENQHAFTGVYYACKEQKSRETRKHLLIEIARLKKLGHNHIVQFVKSYQRGDRYGILLKPAATTNLQNLLGRYCRNRLDFDRDTGVRRKDRVWLKPVFLTAFGCLSRGLAHIHNCSIRHKDIKPTNILYEKEKVLGQKPARFLWADFGLAYDFGDSGDSKTVSKNRNRYSPRYAAPEIMEEAEARKAKGEIDSSSSDDDEEPNAVEHASDESHCTQRQFIGHGRSSDIYSFGIVFLEILSYLVLGESETDSNSSGFEDCKEFWKNIKALRTWAHKQIERLEKEDPLVPLFKLSSEMIAHNANERPVISSVVETLEKANKQYFCTVCLDNPEQPVSQAVIAKEQMVEGLENAKRLSVNSHHVNGLEHGSVHGVESIQQPADVLEENARPRPSRATAYHSGKGSLGKRSSMRSPVRHRDMRQSVQFDVADEIIPDVPFDMNPIAVDDKENHTPSIPSNGA